MSWVQFLQCGVPWQSWQLDKLEGVCTFFKLSHQDSHFELAIIFHLGDSSAAQCINVYAIHQKDIPVENLFASNGRLWILDPAISIGER